MPDWSDIRYAGSAAGVATFALRVAEKFQGPKPELRLRVKWESGSTGQLGFVASVSETRNLVPALDVKVVAEIEEADQVVASIFESQPFDLSAGELNREIRFPVRRPSFGELVPECNNEPTIYGRDLVVTAYSENGGVDVKIWKEIQYSPETDGARFEVMQRYGRFGRGEDTEADRRADLTSGLLRRHEQDDDLI
jgi:hypothetical protein